MADPDVIPMPRQPGMVTIESTDGVRFTPNELRRLKAETGRTMTELLGPDADDGDRMQTLAWLHLLREGTPIQWDACGDVAIEIKVAQPDPTNAGR